MIYLMVGYVLALVIPLFISSWRIAIWAFAAESLVTGLILIRGEGLDSWAARIQALDLILFRSLVVPFCLIGVLKKLKGRREFDTIPANLVVWTIALGLLVASYWFGQTGFPTDFQNAVHLGTAAAGAITGLFILSNQSSPVGQIIGLLALEAGAVLLEALAAHRERGLIQFGLSAVFIWSIGLVWSFLRHFSEPQGEGLASQGPFDPEEKQGPFHHEEKEVL